MTVNSAFNVILPFSNCDSIPPLKLGSQGINPGSPTVHGLISPWKATLAHGVPADLSCSSVLYLSGVTVERLFLRVTHLPPLLQLILTRGLGALGVLHINDMSSS